MVKEFIPSKLKPGDEVRVVAPSMSMALLSDESHLIASSYFSQLRLNLTFGKNTKEINVWQSSSIESRLDDLHAAFEDDQVAAVICAIGGYNSNQLLPFIEWEVIRQNPKIFIGYSDTTALQLAFLQKARLVTYYGADYAIFGQKKHMEYTLKSFIECLMTNEAYSILPSLLWSDDLWYIDQENRCLLPNTGYFVIHPGSAEGKILGGNLTTLNLLKGTVYFPNLSNSILFIEDGNEVNPQGFDRNLQSLLLHPQFREIKALVIGRFQKKTQMTNQLLTEIINTKPQLKHIPVIANVDFGHTDPKASFPIGGEAKLEINDNKKNIQIVIH